MAEKTMQEQLAALRAENDALKAKAEARVHISFKVGEKGGLSMYGLGRFPISLYASQWTRLLAHAPDIQAALIEYADKLVAKPQ